MKQSQYRIKDLPKIERPREKLISKGTQNLKDEELLAILLRTGREGKNVLELARQVLAEYPKKRQMQIDIFVPKTKKRFRDRVKYIDMKIKDLPKQFGQTVFVRIKKRVLVKG